MDPEDIERQDCPLGEQGKISERIERIGRSEIKTVRLTPDCSLFVTLSAGGEALLHCAFEQVFLLLGNIGFLAFDLV